MPFTRQDPPFVDKSVDPNGPSIDAAWHNKVDKGTGDAHDELASHVTALEDFTNESRNIIMSGGGTISWGVVADKMKWTARFVLLPVSENVSGNQHVSLDMPTSGVTSVTGAERASVDGITLNTWESLWLVHTRGGTAFLGNSWKVIPYADALNNTYFDDENAYLIAVRNGDATNGSLYIRNGLVLPPGRTIAEGRGAMAPLWGEVDGKPETFTPTDASVTALKMAAENKGVVICESTTRPVSPVEGQHIYETDTDATLKNTGTPEAPVWTVVGAGAGGAVAADAPLAGDGTTTNHLRIPAATASAPGHMTAVDKAKLNTWVTVMDYGAAGDGVTDDTVAFQAALDASLFIFVPRASVFYNIAGTLKLHDFTIMSGPGLYGNSDGNQPTGGAKIVFTGTAPACIVAADPTTPLVHGGMANMVLRDTGSYSNMFDVPTLAGWKMTSMRMETTSLSANLFRSRKIDPAQPSWVVNWWDVEFRLPDTSTGRTIDVDFSDAAIVAGSSSGGKGAIFRGAGGVKLIGGRYDRSSGSGITLSIEHESKSPYIIEGCEIEENSVNGILLDADALDTRVETWVMPVINGCYFRNHVAGAADIRFKNDTGSIIRGGVVGSNSHVSTAVPIARDPMRWQDVTILPGTVYTKSGHNSYAGGRYLQSPLVLGQSGGMVTLTGTTVETVLATIEVPADSMLANGRLRVVTLWNTSSSAGVKNLRIKFGGTIFRNVAVSGTSQVAAQLMADIQNRNNPAAQVATGGSSNGGAEVSSGILVGAINTRVANNIEIVGQLAATTDSINLQAYLVELIPAQ